MKVCERRRVKRLAVRLPLAFFRFSPDDAPGCIGEIVSISKYGISFTSSESIAPGTMLQLFPKLANTAVGSRPPAFQRTGTVVHVRSWGDGTFEIGLRFTVKHHALEIAEAATTWQSLI